MMKLTLLTLFTIYIISQSQPGCDTSDLEPEDNLCASDSNLKVTGELDCGADYSCCACTSITCTDCENADFGGDNAAFGEKEITLYGKPGDGVSIQAGEDWSLAGGVTLTATNVKEVEFSGDNSFQNGIANIVCLSEDDGCPAKCEGDNSCNGSTITIENVKEFKCGDNSCNGSTITIENVKEFKCGDEGCPNADINIHNPGDGFKFECDGEQSSCAGADIVIIVSDCSNKIDKIGCSSESACMRTKIEVVNKCNIGDYVNIKEFDCEADSACVDAQFTFTGDVRIEDCKCSDNGCDGAGVIGGSGVDCIDPIAAKEEGNKLLKELEHFGDEEENKLENNDENDEEQNVNIVVSLSHSALENIWAIFMVIIVFNVTLFAYYYHKKSKKGRIGDDLSTTRYA